METRKAEADVTLRLERRVAARPEKVFAAWTKAEAVARWFSPNDEYTVVVTAMDLKVGGRYRIEMRHKGGNVSVVGGVYREIEAPHRLVYSWCWEDKPQMGETQVTVKFEPDGDHTRLLLLHERFLNSDDCQRHQMGWNGSLGRLDHALPSL